jgi:hypothetical protein
MNPARWAILAGALGPLFLSVQGCSGGGAGGAHDSGAGGGRVYSPTFTAIYSDILTPSCAQPFCHLGAANPMPLPDQATAYQQIVNAPATGPYCAGMGIRVVPSHPETSILYLKVERPAPAGLCGGSMPGLGRPALAAADIQQIQQWIAMGAKND